MRAETSRVLETDAAQATTKNIAHWFYAFFFASGFCSLLYELVWMRLAMTQFGVTSALTATFLSLFMAGLGLGSWLAGKLLTQRGATRWHPIAVYAITELFIGLTAIAVPQELCWGHDLLLRVATGASWTSFRYTLLSAIWLGVSIIPGCTCMGATFPFAMSALKGTSEQKRSFSYLYLANLLGAMVGVALPLLLIEAFGFLRTLQIGSLINLGIATSALVASRLYDFRSSSEERPEQTATSEAIGRHSNRTAKFYLFAVGVTSMGMEVVWVRLFTPYLGTVIYAFAGILGGYLIATFVGVKLYRSGYIDAVRNWMWFVLASGAFLPMIAADPTLDIPRLFRLPLGIMLPAVAAGFTTPMLVDLESGGDAGLAGSAYAINVLGCIVGPLIAGFVLLPFVGERWSLLILAAPWALVGYLAEGTRAGLSTREYRRGCFAALTLTALGCASAIVCNGFEGQFPVRRVLRDSTATVIAAGVGRTEKRLLVNGYGMSRLIGITKMMAHLPLAFADSPRSMLIVCFGMGTTHRSALSWGIDSTAVELTPSVPRLFSYFHRDGEVLLNSPGSRVVIDDGRRFLERSTETYDVITIDPPPPVEAAGSSLLYSKEFYEAASKRLRSGGVLQQWLPDGDERTLAAVSRAMVESFPYVRAFANIGESGVSGTHFLASNTALPNRTAAQLANRLPPRAVSDLLEWNPGGTAEREFSQLLTHEIPVAELVAKFPGTKALRDDRPVNEYFLIRSLREHHPE
jgi:spermidine synthase